MDVLRRVQTQYPTEWDAFEYHCSYVVSSMLDGEITSSPTGTPSPSPSRSPSHDDTVRAKGFEDRKRTSSLSSLEGLRKRARSKSKDQLSDLKPERRSNRLAFVDQLIKPIQRICKYPLLLDQLASGKTLRDLLPGRISDVNVVVDSASLAMKQVARLVDEARHRQEVALQSSLIVSRISASIAPSLSSQFSMSQAVPQGLTPAFLSSLGICLLAGSLDVMHNQTSNPSSPSAIAKYLGAFLYLGGYLILVKVNKGKVYEPRHWFRLADFDMVDAGEEDGKFLPQIGTFFQQLIFPSHAALFFPSGVSRARFRIRCLMPARESSLDVGNP